jgi:hypothetical protein
VYTIEIENFKTHISAVLEDSLREYDKFRDKNSLKPDLGVLLETVAQLIKEESPVNIDPLRYRLLGLVVISNFRNDIVEEVLGLVFDRVNKDSALVTKQLKEEFTKYRVLTMDSVRNNTYLSFSTELWDVKQYQVSDSKFTIVPKQIDRAARVMYTLFTKSKLWDSYEPDKSLKNLLNRVSLSYEPTVLHENKLYTAVANRGINFNRFVVEEWLPFESKHLDRTQTFNELFSATLNATYREQFKVAEDVNGITSDSKIHAPLGSSTWSESDIDGLVNTFGGGGKLVFKKIRSLLAETEHFGGYEGSVAGSLDYMSEFTLRVRECSTCESIDENFGNFSKLFFSKTELGKMPGLKLLDPIARTLSFNHSLIAPAGVDISQAKVTYNPVHAKFNTGLSVNNNIKFLKTNNSYRISPEYDPINLLLDTLLKRVCYIGDNIFSMSQSVDHRGRIPGYECLGSVEYQLKELQRVFPTLPMVKSLAEKSGGIGGSVAFFKSAYEKFLYNSEDSFFPEEVLQNLNSWLDTLGSGVKDLHGELSTVGIKTSGAGLLPNIETKVYTPTSEKLIEFLSSLGFRDSEINNLIKVDSFDKLISNFAPISDSSDLKSFFKGYELAQLITEFSGETGIDAYIKFLYSKSDVDPLINILNLTLKDPSAQTFVQTSRYPRLVGLLIGLTYAINPEELIKFSAALGGNKLSLLDSVAYLLNKGEKSILKTGDEINILSSVVDQIIRGSYADDQLSPDVNYGQISALEARYWTKNLRGSLGNSTPESVYRLYDKISGMTPRELITVLNNPGPNSSIGQLIDGFNGGNFTKFMRYASISGLAIKLGFYKNSSQLKNKLINFSDKQYSFPVLLDGLEKLYKTIELIKSVIKVRSSSASSSSTAPASTFAGLVSSQNKNIQALLEVINTGEIVNSYPPIEPPGVGNSRLPNREESPNSVSSEQASSIINSPQLAQQVLMQYASEPRTDGFIKFTQKNKFLNNISQHYRESSSTLAEPIAVENTREDNLTTPDVLSVPVVNSGPGKNYLASNYNASARVKPFNPYESCKRFGGSDCDSLYPLSTRDRNNMCVPGINKSLLPQSSVDNVDDNNLVKIDRALGYFSEYMPSSGSLISKNTPVYHGVFNSDTVQIGPDSEPIVPLQTQVDYESAPGALYEYANSKFAVNGYVSEMKKEHNELTCASLTNLYEYRMCMNVLKCRKTNEKLGFCPSTLKGGRI